MAWSSLGRRMVLRGLLAEAPEPTGGNRRSGDGSRGELRRRQVRAGGGDEAAGVGPGLDAPLAAGGDDAEAGGVEPAAFIGSGPEADAPGDHGVAQGALGLVVGRRQGRGRGAKTRLLSWVGAPKRMRGAIGGWRRALSASLWGGGRWGAATKATT